MCLSDETWFFQFKLSLSQRPVDVWQKTNLHENYLALIWHLFTNPFLELLSRDFDARGFHGEPLDHVA